MSSCRGRDKIFFSPVRATFGMSTEKSFFVNYSLKEQVLIYLYFLVIKPIKISHKYVLYFRIEFWRTLRTFGIKIGDFSIFIDG